MLAEPKIAAEVLVMADVHVVDRFRFPEDHGR